MKRNLNRFNDVKLAFTLAEEINDSMVEFLFRWRNTFQIFKSILPAKQTNTNRTFLNWMQIYPANNQIGSWQQFKQKGHKKPTQHGIRQDIFVQLHSLKSKFRLHTTDKYFDPVHLFM